MRIANRSVELRNAAEGFLSCRAAKRVRGDLLYAFHYNGVCAACMRCEVRTERLSPCCQSIQHGQTSLRLRWAARNKAIVCDYLEPPIGHSRARACAADDSS